MGRHADQLIENEEERRLEYLTKKYLPDTLDLILNSEEDLEDYIDKWRDFQAAGNSHATLRDLAEYLTRGKAEDGDYDYLEEEDEAIQCSCDISHFEEGAGRVEPCTCFLGLEPTEEPKPNEGPGEEPTSGKVIDLE